MDEEGQIISSESLRKCIHAFAEALAMTPPDEPSVTGRRVNVGRETRPLTKREVYIRAIEGAGDLLRLNEGGSDG